MCSHSSSSSQRSRILLVYRAAAERCGRPHRRVCLSGAAWCHMLPPSLPTVITSSSDRNQTTMWAGSTSPTNSECEQFVGTHPKDQLYVALTQHTQAKVGGVALQLRGCCTTEQGAAHFLVVGIRRHMSFASHNSGSSPPSKLILRGLFVLRRMSSCMRSVLPMGSGLCFLPEGSFGQCMKKEGLPDKCGTSNTHHIIQI